MNGFNEKRLHTRLTIALPVEIHRTNRESCRGMTDNLSFGGMSIRFTGVNPLESGEECAVSIRLGDSDECVSIDFECRVMHIKEDQAGLKFLSIVDPDCYDHFKNLMVLNCDDPEGLLLELESHPGILV
jgi:c-di-GMP-binding flagellar brake protein YcgR